MLVLPYQWLPRIPICGSLWLPIKPTNQTLTVESNGSIGLLSPFLSSQIKTITTEQPNCPCKAFNGGVVSSGHVKGYTAV